MLNIHNELTGVHIELNLCALTPLHSRQSSWYIFKPVTNYSHPPPRGRQGRLVSDWWALPSFVFDTQRCPASSAIHLPCQWQTRGVMLCREKSGPPYKPPSVPGILFVSEPGQDPPKNLMYNMWQMCPAVVLCENWAQYWGCSVVLNIKFEVISVWYWWIWIRWSIVKCQHSMTFLSHEVFAQRSQRWVMTSQSSVWQA